jgi:hypothetical protein
MWSDALLKLNFNFMDRHHLQEQVESLEEGLQISILILCSSV